MEANPSEVEDLTVLDLFSAAAGGWSLGMHRAGFRTVAAAGKVAWRRALYAENNPGVILYDDVCAVTADRVLADVGALPRYVVGSPPCTDISSANTSGKGVDGEASGLYFEATRIIGEVRPRAFALENSSNLRTRGADRVLGELERHGYTVESFVVRAEDLRANHERARSWLIGVDVDQVISDAAEIRRRTGLSWGCAGTAPGAEQPPRRHALDAQGFGHEGGRAWRRGENGFDAASVAASHAANADSDAVRLAELPGRSVAEAAEPAHASSAGHDAYAAQERPEGLTGGSRRQREGEKPERPNLPPGSQGQLRAVGREGLVGPRADWSLADLARHVRLDDGLSGWLADTRVAVGGPRGTSAASLIVEAFGDAVIPQIPEAIGRAILRTEAALAAIYGQAAA